MNQISQKLTDVLKSQSNNVITKEAVVTTASGETETS